ncbi:MAG: metal ABC transporter ATP-binding protein [Oscillospiraceae bacterium]|jgi:zinc transport system ATP-binding protein|nr:metal ABC transporter ATP-binding protein [Oscillospiraceae bacterium]
MIQVKNLTFSYTGSPPYVLNQLNLEIPDGAYVSIVGENGCGKSTLMRLILKFLKPTSGQILSSAKRIGYVPQKNSASEDGFPITVFEMMDSYRKLLKLKDKQETDANLQKVGMLPQKKKKMSDLSGGQCQKVRIARALLGSPDLLLLDEPSTGIDMQSQQEIYALLKALNQKNRITVIAIEHNLNAAVENSTAIYHIINGRGHLCTPQRYAKEFLNSSKGENFYA